MSTKVIIGIDVSKNTLDGFISSSGEFFQIANSLKGFSKLNVIIKSACSCEQSLLVVFEHTGVYSYRLQKWLGQNNIPYNVRSGLELKRSLGIARGKTDGLDARRIAQYGMSNSLEPVTPPSWISHRLKTLVNLRARLVMQRAGYQNSLKEMRSFMDLKASDVIVKTQQALINALSKQIEKIEQEIGALIEQHNEVKKNLDLLMSIPGIGFVIASCMIAVTDNFAQFTDARKFACYCGTAPFENSSGEFHGKARVSHLANKRIKCMINMAAVTSICHDPEMKHYFQRRIEEGKSKMSTLNIVRNKIIYRMFAVVKRQSPYVKLGNYAA